MNHLQIATRLEQNSALFATLLAGCTEEQAKWRPARNKWSILEVVNHLADADALDFRVRLDLVLHQPAKPWPTIDPDGWVKKKDYNNRDLTQSLKRLQRERRESVAWLRTLREPDWDLEHEHSGAGKFRAGDLLVSWLDHDLIHIRQLVRLRHEYLSVSFPDYSIDYADGEW